MDRGEIHALVIKATQLARGAHRQREELERRPVTWADLLAERVRAEFDFRTFDATLVDLDKVIKRGHEAEEFQVFGDRVTVAAAREQLAESIRSARTLTVR